MFENFIQEVPTFSEEECKLIIETAQADNKWEQATIIDQTDKKTILTNEYRTCDVAGIYENTDIKTMVAERLNAAYRLYSRYLLAAIPKEQLRMPMPMADGSQSWMEHHQVLRYTVGQKYDWHSDTTDWTEGKSSGRIMSVVAYLNNDFEGGSTEFIDGARKAKTGNSLFFPSNWIFYHRAQPVTEGVKYALVTWYHITD